MPNPEIMVDIWLPDRKSSHIEAEKIDNRWEWTVFDDGGQYEGVIYNHEGTYLELLGKILDGRNVS